MLYATLIPYEFILWIPFFFGEQHFIFLTEPFVITLYITAFKLFTFIFVVFLWNFVIF